MVGQALPDLPLNLTYKSRFEKRTRRALKCAAGKAKIGVITSLSKNGYSRYPILASLKSPNTQRTRVSAVTTVVAVVRVRSVEVPASCIVRGVLCTRPQIKYTCYTCFRGATT